MTRNMDYRVEVAVEVLDTGLKKTLNQMLALYQNDNRKLRTMDADGNYQQPQRGDDEDVIDSQMELFRYFEAKALKSKKSLQKDSKKQMNEKQKKGKKFQDEKKEKKKKKDRQKMKQYGFLKKKPKKHENNKTCK